MLSHVVEFSGSLCFLHLSQSFFHEMTLISPLASHPKIGTIVLPLSIETSFIPSYNIVVEVRNFYGFVFMFPFITNILMQLHFKSPQPPPTHNTDGELFNPNFLILAHGHRER